jgi:hypothetical protein
VDPTTFPLSTVRFSFCCPLSSLLADADAFSPDWLNDERVDEFWQEKGSMEQHEKFLAERTADPHVMPVIGSYVETSSEGAVLREAQATYSEIYWVKEDRLGPLMKDVRDYDRGAFRLTPWLPS